MTNNTAFELPITPQIQVSGWAGDRATPGGGPELPVFYPATGQKISVVIEDDVWIASNSVISCGTVIKKGSIIGANSLVINDIPENSFCAGSPAKLIRNI